MRAPRSAARGATVGVFAASSPFPEDRFELGRAALEGLGYRVVVPDAARASFGYLAGDDAHRLAALHALLEDPTIDVLWAARGGYGLHRIVDKVDAALLARAAKPIVGFSDVCALHALAQSKAELISVHGPVVTQLGELPVAEREHVARVIAGDYAGLTLRGEAPIAPGRAEGRLLGGCLSVITPLVGSGLLPDLTGAILLLEDVGEATYRVDRLLTQLSLAGVLGRVAGIAVGELAGCRPRNEREWTAEQVLADRLGGLGVPVLGGLPFGHGQTNHALPLGARASLDADRGTLEILGA